MCNQVTLYDVNAISLLGEGLSISLQGSASSKRAVGIPLQLLVLKKPIVPTVTGHNRPKDPLKT